MSGNQAYQYGEFYRASQHYERAIQTCQETTSEKAAVAGGVNQTNITLGALHSNLSACYFKLGHEDVACSQKFWEKALFHAQRSVKHTHTHRDREIERDREGERGAHKAPE